jgi:hypothetical protein
MSLHQTAFSMLMQRQEMIEQNLRVEIARLKNELEENKSNYEEILKANDALKETQQRSFHDERIASMNALDELKTKYESLQMEHSALNSELQTLQKDYETQQESLLSSLQKDGLSDVDNSQLFETRVVHTPMDRFISEPSSNSPIGDTRAFFASTSRARAAPVQHSSNSARRMSNHPSRDISQSQGRLTSIAQEANRSSEDGQDSSLTDLEEINEEDFEALIDAMPEEVVSKQPDSPRGTKMPEEETSLAWEKNNASASGAAQVSSANRSKRSPIKSILTTVETRKRSFLLSIDEGSSSAASKKSRRSTLRRDPTQGLGPVIGSSPMLSRGSSNDVPKKRKQRERCDGMSPLEQYRFAIEALTVT